MLPLAQRQQNWASEIPSPYSQPSGAFAADSSCPQPVIRGQKERALSRWDPPYFPMLVGMNPANDSHLCPTS